MKTLLVEDDVLLGEGLLKALKLASFAVDWAQDGKQAQAIFSVMQPDLIILDLGLPDIDGLALLAWLRDKGSKASILILTARDTVEDKVKGLDKGADDYLIKPFALEELLARMRALERRLTKEKSSELKVGDIKLDTKSREVSFKGKQLSLSRHEYMLLKALLEQPNRVHTKQSLESNIYGLDDCIGSNTIEVHMHNLRKKICKDFVKTIRGVGYKVN